MLRPTSHLELRHHLDPVRWAAQSLALDPDPAQAEVLRSPARRLLLCCARQWGKSTLAAVRLLHCALGRPRSLCLIIGPSERQSGLILSTIQNWLPDLGISPRRDPRAELSLLLPNSSALIALPANADTVRGFASVQFLAVDEAAYVPDSLYHAVRPMLAVSRGTLWLLSTPAGQSGFFYREFMSAAADPARGFARFVFPATACPRLSPGFLEAEQASLGESVYRREYLCEFTASANQLLTRAILDACLSETEEGYDW